MAQQRQDLETEAKDAAVGYLASRTRRSCELTRHACEYEMLAASEAQHGIEQKLSECLKTLRLDVGTSFRTFCGLGMEAQCCEVKQKAYAMVTSGCA